MNTPGAPAASPVRPWARSAYCGALIAALAGVQARAQVRQLRSGYRPFLHPPSRVAYSWDMFAVRIDRCVVRWDPPLEIDGRRVAAWHDRTYPMEFDTVYDRARDYAAAAAAACAFRTSARTTASVICARRDGRVDAHAFECP